jgi:2-oxo-4-hydroxy-4-carboxy--5-ureidoimidazoline (OHCU) decarboxylase
MEAQRVSLAIGDLNAMDERAFVAAFGRLFEHSPWVAEGAWRRRPFASVGDLGAAFEAALREAPPEHTKDSILASGTARLAHPPARERDDALGEVVKIARLRLGDVTTHAEAE